MRNLLTARVVPSHVRFGLFLEQILPSVHNKNVCLYYYHFILFMGNLGTTTDLTGFIQSLEFLKKYGNLQTTDFSRTRKIIENRYQVWKNGNKSGIFFQSITST